MEAHYEMRSRSGGGEACAVVAEAQPDTASGWHALWTRSSCEQLVRDQLVARGFEPYLPLMRVWRRRAGRRQVGHFPLFPGYLFLPLVTDKVRYVEVLMSRGLVRILGHGWDRPALVPDVQIRTIRTLLRSESPPRSHPYLTTGQRVRIRRGPLAGAEGFLLRQDPNRGILVVSIDLFQRSLAVEVDCTAAVAA